MNFREFVKMYESPSLFGGDIFRQHPGTERVNADKLTWNMHQPGQGGGGGAIRGALPPGALAGSGPGLGNQVPKRMKKMPKK